MSDKLTKAQRNKLMAKVKNKNTDIELIIRKLLFLKGFRYRINYKIYGKPDIAFPKKKVAIFCDGDFWHGKNYKKERHKYNKFWKTKISTNIKRDKTVNSELLKQNWKVLRFWKSEIKKTPSLCIDKIIHTLEHV